MENQENESRELIGQIKTEHYQAFFGEEFSSLEHAIYNYEKGEKTGFNVFAFLFGGLWMLYHRMYKIFFAFMAFIITTGLIQDEIVAYWGLSKLLDSLINFTITIIIGIIVGYQGNKLRIQYAKKSIQSITTRFTDEDSIKNSLMKAGSGNWIVLVVLLAITVLFIILLNAAGVH